MPLTAKQTQEIEGLIKSKVADKLKTFDKKASFMPFLAKIIQDNEKVASYSFIHSMSTMLGMSLYEKISKIIATGNCDECFTKYGVGGVISPEQKRVIGQIMLRLTNDGGGDIKSEVEEVLKASAENGVYQKANAIADFYMVRDGKEYFFEIKTARPNIDVFRDSKEKLLEWIARKRKKVNVYLVFPYNPLYPEPYKSFAEQGIMNPPFDLLIAEEYWNFLGGENTFIELLEVFEIVGKELKAKMSETFKLIAKKYEVFDEEQEN